jgi:hypothetical protein
MFGRTICSWNTGGIRAKWIGERSSCGGCTFHALPGRLAAQDCLDTLKIIGLECPIRALLATHRD